MGCSRRTFARRPPTHVRRRLPRGCAAVSVEFHPQPSNVRPGHRDAHAHAADQPFRYPLLREYAEPDWTRLPAYRDVTNEQWGSAQWQRAHTVKNLKEFKAALGDF